MATYGKISVCECGCAQGHLHAFFWSNKKIPGHRANLVCNRTFRCNFSRGDRTPHGTRSVVTFFAGYGYVTTQDGMLWA